MLLLYQTNAGANNSAIKVLILGDSLSAAYNIPVDRSWPQLFSEQLTAKIPQADVINASISGETTYGGLQRLPQLLKQYAPSHLIVELGGNDGLRGLDFTQTTENLRGMVELAQQQGITLLLIGVRMPPNFGPTYNNRFAQIFETVSNQYSIAYLAKFLDGIAASDADLMQADGIHPTALAQPILARKVLSQILALIDQ